MKNEYPLNLEEAFHRIFEAVRKGLPTRCTQAARSGITIKQLHDAFPVKLNGKGDVRARRIPLGRAAKHFFDVSIKDIKGRVLKPGEEGDYYLWHRGISLL